MSFLKKMTKTPQRSVGIAPVSGLGNTSGLAAPLGGGGSASLGPSSLASSVAIPQDPTGGEPGRAPFSLNLGEYKLVFDDGRWTSQTASKEDFDVTSAQLRKQNRMLIEENNMLKYKVEVLIDMLSVAKADIQTLENAQNRAKGQASPRKR